MSTLRAIYGIALAAMVGFLGWRVVAAEQARQVEARKSPEGTAAERLSRAPLDGDAFADLAVEMRESGEPEQAVVEMHEIAARRDPRDLRVRTWLADHYLRSRNYAEALAHLDVILRLSPEARNVLLPLMAEWADDPGFEKALAACLRARPLWRGAMLEALQQHAIDGAGADAVLVELLESGDLGEYEAAHWIDALMRADRWDVAYRHWTSGLDVGQRPSASVPYNGGFEQPPSNRGFDWRTERQSGTYTEFSPMPGANGNAARLVFLGRPVAGGDLEQAQMLPPGLYRLAMRTRAIALRSDQGLRWTLTCAGDAEPLAASERFDGSFAWRDAEMVFRIPATGCPGQWLDLKNPAPGGSASIVSGEIWFDDLVIRPEVMAADARR